MKTATDVLTSGDFNYRDGFRTYSHYNYLRPGPIAWLKRRRFETALALATPYLHPSHTCVIDFGCADGFFLPALAERCRLVTGIEIDSRDVETAQHVASRCTGADVRVLCNRDTPFAELRKAIGRPHDVLFLLETLEHVGTREAMTESRIAFLRDLFTLLVPDGVIIVSVPKMVGPAFLAKYAAQSALRMPHEPMRWRDALRATFNDTDRLEPTWVGGHRGFNHVKLARAMRRAFAVRREVSSLTSAFYVLHATP